MTKIVNSLSVKMAPMVNMYLLKNPDHYCSHNFRNCYWQAFQGKQVVGLSPVLDYIWQPLELESLSLYDWIMNCTCEKRRKRNNDNGNQSNDHMPQNSDNKSEPREFVRSGRLLSFASEHPLAKTHGVCWLSNKQKCVPNFLGPTLPRQDHGDRDYYCSTMLTFFKPWNSGYDLKTEEDTWEEAFDKYTFAPYDCEVMCYANIHYECLDSFSVSRSSWVAVFCSLFKI
ncbi:hypothetical protein L208DRAFT_1323984 [Tricholoma matsutake]|nr:hypothetical protein L208DRAFT_1323984 [Tricholoma matsutake 945]